MNDQNKDCIDELFEKRRLDVKHMLAVENAKRFGVCRICRGEISPVGCPEGWQSLYNEMHYPVHVILAFGTEFAHAKCLKEETMANLQSNKPIRPEWQQRVIWEKKELDEKIGKLAKFLSDEQRTCGKPYPNSKIYTLLCAQHLVMQQYSNILGERIENFEA